MIEIASDAHPNWQNLNDYSRRLHTRNVFQILGSTLTAHSGFVICWTLNSTKSANETSVKTGGTGQATRVASKYGVKVYNLANLDDFELATNWINKNK